MKNLFFKNHEKECEKMITYDSVPIKVREKRMRTALVLFKKKIDLFSYWQMDWGDTEMEILHLNL